MVFSSEFEPLDEQVPRKRPPGPGDGPTVSVELPPVDDDAPPHGLDLGQGGRVPPVPPVQPPA